MSGFGALRFALIQWGVEYYNPVVEWFWKWVRLVLFILLKRILLYNYDLELVIWLYCSKYECEETPLQLFHSNFCPVVFKYETEQ